MSVSDSDYFVRRTEEADVTALVEISDEAYPLSGGWSASQFRSQIRAFPEGQFVVVERRSGVPVGMAASLVVNWRNFSFASRWQDITSWGHFRNHDPGPGRTLYGAEIMVRPEHQGRGVGKLLYAARERLACEAGLLNIRAGARISGYHHYASKMDAREYARRVVHGDLADPTLSFQLKRGFRAIGLTPDYFYDPESHHYAVVIEWLNPEVARPEDWLVGDPDLRRAKPAGLPSIIGTPYIADGDQVDSG